jgi:hypothetical protein
MGAAGAAGPNAGLTQAALLARLRDALAGVHAMHMKGAVDYGGSSMTVDMQLNQDGSAQGTLVEAGTVMPIIVVGGATYTQVTAADAANVPGGSGARAGDWVEQAGDTDSMTDFETMVQELDSPSKYSYSYQGTSTIGGRAIARYEETAVGSGGVDKLLSIPLSGPALPVSADSGAQGEFTFTWGAPTKVYAPAPAEVITTPSTSGSASRMPRKRASR